MEVEEGGGSMRGVVGYSVWLWFPVCCAYYVARDLLSCIFRPIKDRCGVVSLRELLCQSVGTPKPSIFLQLQYSC